MTCNDIFGGQLVFVLSQSLQSCMIHSGHYLDQRYQKYCIETK